MRTFEKVNAMEDLIIESLGEAGALDAICQALDYDTKEDIYDYIIRMYDIEEEEEE